MKWRSMLATIHSSSINDFVRSGITGAVHGVDDPETDDNSGTDDSSDFDSFCDPYEEEATG